jgi:uncharacterized integral membrane protein
MAADRREEEAPGVSPRLVGAAILIVLVLVFVFENTAKAQIRFVIPRVTVPLWVALFVAMFVGIVVGALLARHRRRR